MLEKHMFDQVLIIIDTNDTGKEGRRQNSQTVQGSKQTANNLNIEGNHF